MRELAVATNWINVILAAGVVIACLSIGGRISRETRCAVRLGIFAIFAGALLMAAGGIWEFGQWVQTVFTGGVLVYLIANLRSPVVMPSATWANRIAWVVGVVVLGVFGVTFGIGCMA